LLFPSGVGEQTLAEALQAQWQTELGVEVTLMPKDADAWTADLASRNFVIARVGWWGDTPDPLNFLEPWTTVANNPSGYSNPKFDALVARARALTDAGERAKAVKEAEALLLSEAPLIPLFTYASNQLIDLTKWEGWSTNVFDVHSWKNLGPKK
jgi:oligopeptide transport system substrate-binding protein